MRPETLSKLTCIYQLIYQARLTDEHLDIWLSYALDCGLISELQKDLILKVRGQI